METRGGLPLAVCLLAGVTTFGAERRSVTFETETVPEELQLEGGVRLDAGKNRGSGPGHGKGRSPVRRVCPGTEQDLFGKRGPVQDGV